MKIETKKGLALLVLFIIPLIYFYPFLFGYIPYPGEVLGAFSPWRHIPWAQNIPLTTHNFWLFDAVRAIYPWQFIGIEIMKGGQWPLWNLYAFAGTPLLANNQSALLYPLNVLYFVFDFSTAWGLLTILQPVLAALFLYMLLGEYKLNPWSRCWGAILFAWSGFFGTYLHTHTLGHTLLWLPLALLAVHKLTNYSSLRWSGVFIFSITALLTAGYLQTALYYLLLLILYILLVLKDRKGAKTKLYLFLLLVIALGISSPQLLPLVEILKDIARDSTWYTDFLLSPMQILRFLLPHVWGHPATGNWLGGSQPKEYAYIGVLGLLLASVGSFTFRKNRKTFFWTTTVLFITIIAVKTPLTEFVYRQLFPFLQIVTPLRAFGLVDLGLAILSAKGFEWVYKQKDLGRNKLIVLSLSFLVVSVGLVIYHYNIVPIDTAVINTTFFIWIAPLILLFSFVALIGYKARLLKRSVVICIIFLLGIVEIVSDNALYARTFTAKNQIFPQTELTSFLSKNIKDSRFLSLDPWTLPPNSFLPYHLESVNIYDPVHYYYSHQFAEEWRKKTNPESPPFTRAVELTTPNQKLLNLTNTKYVISPNPLTIEYLKLLKNIDGIYVYENTTVFPRIYLVGKTIIALSEKDAIKNLLNKNVDLQQTVILNEQPALAVEPGKGDVKLLKSTTQGSIWQVTSSTRQLLFLSQSYNPGWNATIDGEKAKILRANLAFQAISTPEGTHKVSFFYNPLSFRLGLLISISTLLAVFLGTIIIHFMKAKSSTFKPRVKRH